MRLPQFPALRPEIFSSLFLQAKTRHSFSVPAKRRRAQPSEMSGRLKATKKLSVGGVLPPKAG